MGFLRRRVITSIVVFFVTLNLIFILPRLVPGNAAEILAASSKLPSEYIKLLYARFGLDQPLITQYFLFLKGIFSWPPYFGVSYQYFPSQVSYLFFQRLPWTLALIAASFILALTLAYVVASFGSLRRKGGFEMGSLFTSIILHSTPVFWIAMVLLWIFSVKLHWFPIFGMYSPNVPPGLNWPYISSIIWHMVLPVIAMALSIFGEIYLVLRSSTQRILSSDYVLAAKTRGLKEMIISRRYILRNSLLPLVSLLSFSLASLLSRVILVEAIFGYAGVGDLVVDAVLNRDYPVLEGSLFYFVLMVIIGGLIGDFILVRLDPRLRR